MKETSNDHLLNSRIVLEQPREGYRIAVDTLLLASTVSHEQGARILDMGCGVGGVMIAIACRLPDVQITGLEIQNELTALCIKNIHRNKYTDRLNLKECDVKNIPAHMHGQFDHIVMNPPFHDAVRHDGSPNKSKKRAHLEQAGEIEQWLASAAQATHDTGIMTMITRADRREEIITKMQIHFQEVQIKPIWSNTKGKCKRIILRGAKSKTAQLIERDPFILYGTDGRYSQAGDDLLRNAQEMPY